MSHSSALSHLQALLRHGLRPIGTPANQQAADYLRDTFTAFGLADEAAQLAQSVVRALAS